MTARPVLLAGMLLLVGLAVRPVAAQEKPASARQQAAPAQPHADLDRLSDLGIALDELRADGADDLILADARARIAAELRRDVSESEGAPDRAAADTSLSSAKADSERGKAGARVAPRVRARAAQIVTRKRALIGDLRLLQLRIDAGTDDTPALEAQQDTLLAEYLKLSREEIRLGVREIAGERAEPRGRR